MGLGLLPLRKMVPGQDRMRLGLGSGESVGGFLGLLAPG